MTFGGWGSRTDSEHTGLLRTVVVCNRLRSSSILITSPSSNLTETFQICNYRPRVASAYNKTRLIFNIVKA